MIDALTSVPGWQVYIWVTAIVVPAGINMRHAARRDRSGRAEIALMYVLGVSGAIGMSNVVLHTAFAADVAGSIGWPAGNPFQTEVGFANLAVGMVGFACFWRYDFWLPAIAAKSVFAWGAGLTHLMDIIQSGNMSANNAGPILAWDFLLPIVAVTLYVVARPARERTVVTPALHWSARWRLGVGRAAD